MIPYKTKLSKITGSSDTEVFKKARKLFDQIEKRTKRKPYLISPYFKKQKVFFDFFWFHLNQKSKREKVVRLRLLPLAIDLISNSRNKPTSKPNPNKKSEILHRFAGLIGRNEQFYVQIKEDTKKKKLYFMSVFPMNI
jgi:hypothetical protein